MNDPEQAQPGEEQTLHFFLTQPLSVWNAEICLGPGSAPRRNRLAYGSKRIPRTAELRSLLFGGHKTASSPVYFLQYADDKRAFIYSFLHGSGVLVFSSNQQPLLRPLQPRPLPFCSDPSPCSEGPSLFTFKGNSFAKFRVNFLPNYL